jgi:uncharacterized phage infection (PIP) family protein YhgE
MTRLFLFFALLGSVFTVSNAIAQDDDLVKAGYEAEAKRASIAQRIDRFKRGFKQNEAKIRERQAKQIEKNEKFMNSMDENRHSLNERSSKVNERSKNYKSNLEQNKDEISEEREVRVNTRVNGLSGYTPNEKTRTQEQEDKRGLIDAYRSNELAAIKTNKPADGSIKSY